MFCFSLFFFCYLEQCGVLLLIFSNVLNVSDGVDSQNTSLSSMHWLKDFALKPQNSSDNDPQTPSVPLPSVPNTYSRAKVGSCSRQVVCLVFSHSPSPVYATPSVVCDTVGEKSDVIYSENILSPIHWHEFSNWSNYLTKPI